MGFPPCLGTHEKLEVECPGKSVTAQLTGKEKHFWSYISVVSGVGLSAGYYVASEAKVDCDSASPMVDTLIAQDKTWTWYFVGIHDCRSWPRGQFTSFTCSCYTGP